MNINRNYSAFQHVSGAEMVIVKSADGFSTLALYISASAQDI